MANITINNTTKKGWFSLYNGALGTDGETEHHCLLEDIGGICMRTIDGVNGLELHINHEENIFLLTDGATGSYFLQVDSVNGVAPSSISDLRDKILDLFRLDFVYNTPANVSCLITTTTLVASNTLRKGLILTNTGSYPIYIAVGTSALASKGIYLVGSGGVWEMDVNTFTTDAINGIAIGGTTNISIQELQ